MNAQQYQEKQHQEMFKVFTEDLQKNKLVACQRVHAKLKIQKRWTIDLEKIMKEYTKCQVYLGNYNEIKEIMNQYRKITQIENTESLTLIYEFYRESIEKKFEEKIKSVQIPENLGDLDVEEQPEELITYAINIQEKERRDNVKSILKMKLDCYKTIIQNIKANKKLEQLHSDTVFLMIQFLEKYNRVSELQKFVASISKTLNDMRNYFQGPNQHRYANSLDLQNKETQSKSLDIRFRLYEVCKKFKLEQSSLKCMDDVKILINLRSGKKDETKKRYISQYYENMAEIFWKSQYYNFHGFFFYQHFNLFLKYNDQSDKTQISSKANKVVLSILSIPYNTQDVKFTGEKWYKIREFILEASKYIPSSDDMARQLKNTSILDECSPAIQELYTLLSKPQINIFTVSKSVNQILSEIKEPEFQQFLPLIKEKIGYKSLQQLSKIYRTLKFQRLREIIDFLSEQKLINMLLESSAAGLMRCQIDFRKNIVTFGKKQKLENFADSLLLISEKCKRVVLQFQETEYDENEMKSEVKEYLKYASGTVVTRLQEIRKIKTNQKKINVEQMTKQDRQQQILEELERKRKEREEEYARAQEKKRQLIVQEHLRKVNEQIQEIMGIKDKQVVKIGDVRIENLTDEDKVTLDLATFSEVKEQILEKQKNNLEERALKKFQKYDYIARAIRNEEIQELQKLEPNQDELDKVIADAKKYFDQNLERKQKIEITVAFKEKFFNKVVEMRQKKYTQNLEKFKEACESFREEIEEKAIKLFEEDKKRREEEAEAKRLLLEQEQEEKIANTEGLRRNQNATQNQQVDAPLGFVKGALKQPSVPVEEEKEEQPKKEDFSFKKGGATVAPADGFQKGGAAAGSMRRAPAKNEDEQKKEERGWGKGGGNIASTKRDEKPESKGGFSKGGFSKGGDDGWTQSGGGFKKGGGNQSTGNSFKKGGNTDSKFGFRKGGK